MEEAIVVVKVGVAASSRWKSCVMILPTCCHDNIHANTKCVSYAAQKYIMIAVSQNVATISKSKENQHYVLPNYGSYLFDLNKQVGHVTSTHHIVLYSRRRTTCFDASYAMK